MATDLQVRRVSLGGIDTPHSWDLPRGVTVIAGDSGVGKTSLLNLIKYGFGGDATITKTIVEAAESVIVEAHLNGREIHLTRRFSSKKNVIEVREEGRAPIEYSIRRGNKRPWISDLLLDALGIPSIRVPQSRSKKSHKLTPISFLDVFAYCYLDQEQIDRSTVFDDESPGRGPKRPWTFELLFGLIDSRVAELEAAREELAEETEQREKRLASVEQFVEVKQLPGTFAEVSRRLEEVNSEVEEVEGELAAQERALEQAITDTAGRHGRVTAVGERLATALAEQRRIEVESREVSRAANQLERDLDAAREGEAAGEVLDPLTYEICPRCEQQLGERQAEEGHCPVCLQTEPLVESEREHDSTTLAEQLGETRALVEQLSRAQAAAEREVEGLREALDAERRAFAQASDQASLPFRRRIAELQDRLGMLQGERRTLSAGLPLEQALRDERRELTDASPEIAELDEGAKRRRDELSQARSRVDDLSKAFDEVLHRFTLPWLQSAEVDPRTYLPIVNGLSLRELSSGGMKTTTNVAYYLAVFVTALRDQEILLPSFLMLDSIRKASGAGKEDLARSERIYTYLQTLQELRHPPRPLPRDFQLIVVDNDMPKQFESHFNTIRIDIQNPLIRL
jgi:uncharacterized Zn finger protein (UPF0148 family)